MTRASRAGIVGAAIAFAACVQISEPPAGVFTVSDIRAAYPAVVVGDTLRDSLGNVTPLRIVGLTSSGDTVRETPTWVTLDRGLRVTSAGLVIGDSVRTGARVVGQLGGLQTPPLTLSVVPAPTEAKPAQPTIALTTWTRKLGDTSVISSPALGVKVMSGENPVAGWVVSYDIASGPPALSDSSAAVYVAEWASRRSRVDTTDASGLASRIVVLRPVGSSVGGADTVVVRATVRYKGHDLAGSPILFTVPFRRQ